MYARQAPTANMSLTRNCPRWRSHFAGPLGYPRRTARCANPRAITSAELAKGLSAAGNGAWLDAVDFGADARKRSQEHLERRTAAQTIGLPVELADRLERLSPDALASFGSEMLRQSRAGRSLGTSFPNARPRTPRIGPNVSPGGHRMRRRRPTNCAVVASERPTRRAGSSLDHTCATSTRTTRAT